MSRRLPPTPQTPFLLGEVDDIPFRFGAQMTPGEAIATVAVDCVSVGAVADATPLASVAEPYQVVGTDVVQRFQALVAGARYVVSVRATLDSGRVFIGAALVPVVPVVPA